MEERNTDPQFELLAKIHNQLVDLTKLIAEVEMSKTQSSMLKTQIHQIEAKAAYVDGSRPGAVLERQQKVIAPTDLNIEPGEGNNGRGK